MSEVIKKIDLSVIIPCYNESNVIFETFEDTFNSLIGNRRIGKFEIIFVDDGSTDSTFKKLQDIQSVFAYRHFTKLIHRDYNRGKGYSVREGILAASYKNICFMDADNSAPIGNIFSVIHEIIEYNEKDEQYFLIGDRCNQIDDRSNVFRRFMSHVSKFYVCHKFYLDYGTDTQCGFKIFDNRTGKMFTDTQTIFDFAFDVEYIMIAFENMIEPKSFSVVWNDFTNSKSSVKPVRSTFRFLDDCNQIIQNVRNDKYLVI